MKNGHKLQKRTLFFQVLMIVVIIFISIVLFNSIQDIFRERIYRESQKLMQVSSCFNDISLKLQKMQDNWKAMVENTDETEVHTDIESILKYAEQLSIYLNEKKYNRSSIDLYYTIETYIEELGELEAAIRGSDFSKVAIKTVACTQNYEFVQERLNQVYKDIQKQYTVSGEQMNTYEKWQDYIKLSSLFVVVLMGGVLLIILNRTIIYPVDQLSKSAAEFTLENRNTRTVGERIKVKNEISILYNQIAQMQERICNQYEQLLQKAELEKKLHEDEIKMIENEKWLKEAQLRNLQARINPHFFV